MAVFLLLGGLVKPGFALLSAGALVAGCGGRGGEVRSDSSAVPAAESVATSPTVDPTRPAVGGGCPTWGLWQPCSVEDRLARSGLLVERLPEPVRHDFMRVPAVAYATRRRTEIQVFLYPTTTDRARDTDALDTATVAPRGRRVVWRQPATLVTSINLAAIILGLNEREVERVALALGAGLPAGPGR